MSKNQTKASFILGLINPEDLARVPDTDWVIACGHSAMAAGQTSESTPHGYLYLVHIKQRKGEDIYPHSARYALDRGTYGDVAQPTEAVFNPHGLALGAGANKIHTLYVVNHGGREAVEVFSVDCRAEKPEITWIGAVIMPEWCMANDVAPHPGGGFIVSNFCTGGMANIDRVYSGVVSGNVLHWQDKNTEFKVIPGSNLNSPNGVEISADGQWCYINSWARREVVKISTSGDASKTITVKVDFLTDNFTWTDDKKYLITTGQIADPAELIERYVSEEKIGYPFKVIQIDPDTMAVKELVWYDNPDEFGLASAALLVGNEVWVGTARYDKLAIFDVE